MNLDAVALSGAGGTDPQFLHVCHATPLLSRASWATPDVPQAADP